jgi:1-acyl-sn-glycerol-3-phosphate acyltransferase
MGDLPFNIWYTVNFWLSMASMTAAFSLRTEGHDNVPSEGPALLIANHQSFLDPVIIGLAARRRLRFLARRTLFDNWAVRWIINSFKAVPINQEGFAREGLKAILGQLQAGQAVVVFPEGERTVDGKVHALRPGIRLLIKRVDMPIVPIGIAGAYEAWPRARPYPSPAPLFLPARDGAIAISIGQAIPSLDLAALPREQMLDNLLEKLNQLYERAEHLRRKP